MRRGVRIGVTVQGESVVGFGKSEKLRVNLKLKCTGRSEIVGGNDSIA